MVTKTMTMAQALVHHHVHVNVKPLNLMAISYRHRFHRLRPRASGAPLEQVRSGHCQRMQPLLPVTLEQSVDQARSACRCAVRDGLLRLQLELLLPLIGATDLDDWPGGIQQQFKAASPVVFSLLDGLIEGTSSEGQMSFNKYLLDEGNATGVWENEKVTLVLFPTAESVEAIENFGKVKDRPLLLLNPQWKAGQVISDFGFGEERKRKESFVESFHNVYSLKKIRILGEDVCILKCYPGLWQVIALQKDGNPECIASEAENPSYKRLQELLKSREGSIASKGWFGRILNQLNIN